MKLDGYFFVNHFDLRVTRLISLDTHIYVGERLSIELNVFGPIFMILISSIKPWLRINGWWTIELSYATRAVGDNGM